MFDVEVEDLEKVEGQITEFERRLTPLALTQFLLGRVDPYLRDRISIRFDREGDDVVGKWRELREQTAIIRRRQGYGGFHPINERTGALRRFVVQTVEVRSTGTGAALTKPARGGNAELQRKLRAAQTGGVAPSGSRFPARRVLGLNGRDTDQVMDRLSRFLEEAFEGGQ